MALPVPNLDDRTFQDLVSEARSRIPRYCPEWTDHNLSDPGITMIELFSWMTEVLLYRLNKVPEKNYITFLDLIGVRLSPATPATTDMTFYLSAPQPNEVSIAKGTEVATVRTETQEAIVFTTTEELCIKVPTLEHFLLTRDGENFVDFTQELNKGKYHDLFREVPQENNAFYIGFTEPLGGHVVALTFDCQMAKGVGINPDDPPLVWEYWDGALQDWQPFDRKAESLGWLESDATGAFNRRGDVVLHIPHTFAPNTVSLRRAHWIRCRIIEPQANQAAYGASPAIASVSVVSKGGTIGASHGVLVVGEELGSSNGDPGQLFQLENNPILALDKGEVVAVRNDDGTYDDWEEVADFSQSSPQDKHFLCDSGTGEIRFGPGIRQTNGEVRQYGAIPKKGKTVKMAAYRYGGGSVGNVGKNSLSVLKSSIPYVAAVTNRRAASGGTDPESVESAKMRGPQMFRTRNRAVTESDFEFLALESSPSVARAKCVQPRESGDGSGGPPPGVVMIQLIPHVSVKEGRIPPEQLDLSRAAKEEVQAYLDDRRMLCTMLVISAPTYHWVSVEARVKAKSKVDPGELRVTVENELYRFLNPLTGGPEGKGWPFGRDLIISEVYSCIQHVEGVEYVETAQIYPVEMPERNRGDETQRIMLPMTDVLCSYEHDITVF